MKLTYYGTAAAEGFPGIFCECVYCKRARALGGKNLRSRSQALVDDSLLIDFPPDTLHHVYAHGLPLHKIHNVIITHRHSDHFYPTDFGQRRETYAHFDGEPFPLNIYGSQPTIDSTSSFLMQAGIASQPRWELFELEPFQTYSIGDHYVTPLKAVHDYAIYPLIFDIADKTGKHMLYGNDTGEFSPETCAYLEKERPLFSLVSLDCTAGLIEQDYTCHMNLRQDVKMKDYLLGIGCADQNTVFVAHHFSHNGGAVYDDFAPIAQVQGFLTSYDGMEIIF